MTTTSIKLPCGKELQTEYDPAAGLSLHLSIEIVCSRCRSRGTCVSFHYWIRDNHRELSDFIVSLS